MDGFSGWGDDWDRRVKVDDLGSDSWLTWGPIHRLREERTRSSAERKAFGREAKKKVDGGEWEKWKWRLLIFRFWGSHKEEPSQKAKDSQKLCDSPDVDQSPTVGDGPLRQKQLNRIEWANKRKSGRCNAKGQLPDRLGVFVSRLTHSTGYLSLWLL